MEYNKNTVSEKRLKFMNDDINHDELSEKRKEKIDSFHLSIEREDTPPQNTVIEDLLEENTETILLSDESDISYSKSEGQFISSYSEGKKADDFNTPVSSQQWQDKQSKKAEKHRKKLKAKKNGCLFRMIWLVMVVLVSVIFAQYVMVGVNDMLAITRTEEKIVSITIPKDASLDQITDILYDNGVISSKTFFKLYANVTKSTAGFTQGTFDIETNRDYQSIINFMQSDMNRTDVVTIQFTEGMTILEYANLLEKNQVCSAEDFLKVCNSNHFDEDYTFLKELTNVSKRYYKLEGYLFPDTYNFYVGEDPYSVVRKFLANYTQKIYYTKSRVEGFEDKVTVEERAESIGMTVDEVTTLASLIQAEAANKDDMYVISSILHNRLNTIENGGNSPFGDSGLNYLQLDSTIYYPYRSLNKVPSSIRKNFESRYNTYNIIGLPYGAICNPGMDAIEAALTIEESDYYYFCHKAAEGDQPAEAYYASTLQQQLDNMAMAGLT